MCTRMGAEIGNQYAAPLFRSFGGPLLPSVKLMKPLNCYKFEFWLPPRDSNPDMLIQSQLSYH